MVYNNVKPKRAQYFFCVLIFLFKGSDNDGKYGNIRVTHGICGSDI